MKIIRAKSNNNRNNIFMNFLNKNNNFIILFPILVNKYKVLSQKIWDSVN
jgi:hypothetical protein